MLDNDYDYMHAMQDAMDEKKFMLVLTLLSKTAKDEVVQQKNKKDQNLFHILAMNADGCSEEHLKRIYQTLLKRGVDVRAKDSFARNALHYAVIGNSLVLVKMLLQSGDGYNPNEVDKEGHSPLSLCLKGKNSEIQYYYPAMPYDNIFMSLAKSGADMNFVYPEEVFKPGFKDEEVEDLDNYDPKGHYYTTPMINLIRHSP
jgi:ankyrin repeat protein